MEVKIESLKGTTNEEPNIETPTTSLEDVREKGMREKGKEASGRVRSNNPSVSIENDVTMELTEELLVKQEVESCDSLPLKAMSTNSGGGGAMGGEYIHVHVYSEEESDGDHTDGDQLVTTGGDTASGGDQIEPTDSVRGSIKIWTQLLLLFSIANSIDIQYVYFQMISLNE